MQKNLKISIDKCVKVWYNWFNLELGRRTSMKLIDANEAIINFGFEWDDIPPTREEFVRFLKKQPTVDAVPVVRCRECKHHRDKNEQERQYLVEDILICTSPDATDDCWNAVWPDHFCSYGEKEGADNG